MKIAPTCRRFLSEGFIELDEEDFISMDKEVRALLAVARAVRGYLAGKCYLETVERQSAHLERLSKGAK